MVWVLSPGHLPPLDCPLTLPEGSRVKERHSWSLASFLAILNLSSYLGSTHAVSSAQWVCSELSDVQMFQAGNLQQDLLLALVIGHVTCSIWSPRAFSSNQGLVQGSLAGGSVGTGLRGIYLGGFLSKQASISPVASPERQGKL